MNTVKYLVDNNVLSTLTHAQRTGKFMREHCRISAEVLHEARGLPDRRALKALDYPVTPEILERVRRVMASVPVGDHKLVDLCRNEGNADPILIATALCAEAGEGTLWQTDWQIVTDDKALRAKSAEFDVTCLGRAQFVELLDA